eukprot:scaffold3426_cov355-Prasinococcus_capsulatus_cf.AAC.6
MRWLVGAQPLIYVRGVVYCRGNCCGYSPVCASTASVTAPQWVAQHCAENGIVSVCGFPAAVTSCQCVEGTCTTS